MSYKKSPKICEINDFLQWETNKELELSPKYQRGMVWNEKTKQYLIDTIIRGLPIPPIFMRQIIDVKTNITTRQILDGQQRLRAIIEFFNNKYKISMSHNKTYGGMYYRDLSDAVKEDFLSFQILVESINEKDDSVIYDMFSRLNTNNMALNHQELRNAKYWGEFKVLAYDLASQYRDFLIEYKVFNDRELSRMLDVELISNFIIVLIDGIVAETPKIIDNYYLKYNDVFLESDKITSEFDEIMGVIREIFDYLQDNIVCFNRKVYFYTLFACLDHQIFGIKSIDVKYRKSSFSKGNIHKNIYNLKNDIAKFERVFDDVLNDRL